MRILNTALTLIENADQNGRVNCVAGCMVELNVAETAALLNPWHGGFRLTCTLMGVDPGPDSTIFNFGNRPFNNIGQIFQVNQVFQANFARAELDEDAGPGVDELQAAFILVDMSNGRSVSARSSQVRRNFG